jgi:hypothetical protein
VPRSVSDPHRAGETAHRTSGCDGNGGSLSSLHWLSGHRAGLDGIHLHTLRHSAAGLLLAVGTHIRVGSGRTQDHLHHGRDRVAELPTPQDHQEPGHFPSDDAVVRLLWLAIRDIEDKRARERAKERGKPANERTAPPHLVEGAVTQGWKPALAALLIAFPDRLDPYLQ